MKLGCGNTAKCTSRQKWPDRTRNEGRGSACDREVPLHARKIRELVRDLEQAGFVDCGGRGSHRNYLHPGGVRVTVSGKLGDDAKPYQEREVWQPIVESGEHGEAES